MMDRRLAGGAVLLLSFGALALAAPWLGLRDPAAQPDTLVLRNLPPLSRVHAIDLADGQRRWAEEIRVGTDGAVEYLRGGRWTGIDRAELADDWQRRPWFVLGTDGLGRDLLSRMLFGARVSLWVGLVAAVVALGVGVLVGALAGLAAGWVDAALMRATDVVLAVPRLFLALLLVALYEPSVATTVLVLGGTTWMAAARLVRGEILSLREREFVAAARATGAHRFRVGCLHVLPAATAPLWIEGCLRVGEAILLESALSFLGLGVPAPTPSWGNLVADGRAALLDAWWIATLPGLAIAATVIALNLVGDAARERVTRAGRTA